MGKPGVLLCLGLQRVRHELATEQMLNVDVSQSDQHGLQNNPEQIKIVSLGEIQLYKNEYLRLENGKSERDKKGCGRPS